MSGISIYKGLAVNGNYLYQYHYYTSFGDSFWGIARTDLTTRVRTGWKNITESTFETVSDFCGDTTYLYLLGETKVIIVDYSGTFIRDISVSEVYGKICSDGTNIYLNTSSTVDIYTITGTFIRTIEGVI